ncbi:MAG: flagellar biosynthesis anti-sigma factor FlgM [Thiovulaceae bacterium]|nr:flagellar biosynthesis anti-sigma factor FlgM [Sulfurimonadaceae bacterium]
MINQLNSVVGSAAFQSINTEVKSNTKKTEQMNKDADMSKVGQLKDSIASGEYKLDLSTLSKRIADELLQ